MVTDNMHDEVEPADESFEPADFEELCGDLDGFEPD